VLQIEGMYLGDTPTVAHGCMQRTMNVQCSVNLQNDSYENQWIARALSHRQQCAHLVGILIKHVHLSTAPQQRVIAKSMIEREKVMKPMHGSSKFSSTQFYGEETISLMSTYYS
jgi:hypothetical protein